MPEKKNTYLTLHKNFVRTDIEYTDRVTGEVRTFNSVTLPKGTVIDGVDVSYYQFSPMFVNESRYRGENYRDIPLLTDREVWLKKSVLDENGQPVLNGDGKPAKDVVRVMPAQKRRRSTAAAASTCRASPRRPAARARDPSAWETAIGAPPRAARASRCRRRCARNERENGGEDNLF